MLFEANFCQSRSNWDSNINSHATVPYQFCHETKRLEATAFRRLEKWKCIRKSSKVPLEKWKGMRGQYSVAKWMVQEILFINQGSLEDDILWHLVTAGTEICNDHTDCTTKGDFAAWHLETLCWASLWRWQTQVFLLQHWDELGELCFLLLFTKRSQCQTLKCCGLQLLQLYSTQL